MNTLEWIVAPKEVSEHLDGVAVECVTIGPCSRLATADGHSIL